MIGLSCQFEMYLNIMLEIHKMVKDGVKTARGAMIAPEMKRKAGLWEYKSHVSKF